MILILIVIAFRGCLDARKDRSYQNYVSDLSSIIAETEQLSSNFFDRLGGNKNAGSDIGFEARSTATREPPGAARPRQRPRRARRRQGRAGTGRPLLRAPPRRDRGNRRPVAGAPAARRRRQGGAGDLQADEGLLGQRHPLRPCPGPDRAGAHRQGDHRRQRRPRQPVPARQVPTTSTRRSRPMRSAGSRPDPGGVSHASCNDGETHGLGLVDRQHALRGTALGTGARTVAAVRRQRDRGRRPEPGQPPRAKSRSRSRATADITGTRTIDQIAAGETQTVKIPLEPGAEGRRQRHRHVEVDRLLRAGRRQQQGAATRSPSRKPGAGGARAPPSPRPNLTVEAGLDRRDRRARGRRGAVLALFLVLDLMIRVRRLRGDQRHVLGDGPRTSSRTRPPSRGDRTAASGIDVRSRAPADRGGRAAARRRSRRPRCSATTPSTRRAAGSRARSRCSTTATTA